MGNYLTKILGKIFQIEIGLRIPRLARGKNITDLWDFLGGFLTVCSARCSCVCKAVTKT